MSEPPYVTTFTGDRVYLDDPSINLYNIFDIAHGLSLLCRYAGQCPTFYSVAQHSVLVSENVPPEDALWGLLHDASEAYLVDVPRPVKYLPEMRGYRELEARIQSAIVRQFGLSPDEPVSVRKADALLAQEEMREFRMRPRHWSNPEVAVVAIESPIDAYRLFIGRYCKLYYGAGLSLPKGDV
jgi:uncharacterized protein